MNHIYKSIFNKALGVFTAVPEFASAHGKGSERAVVGRVAKGTAGFAASALAISVGLALTSTSAVAGPGIYINDGTDTGCLAIPDAQSPNVGIHGISGGAPVPGLSLLGPSQVVPDKSYYGLDVMKPCLSSTGTAAEERSTQTNRTLFYGGNSYTKGTITDNGAKNLTLGGRLDVNSGIIGVGDRGADGAGATNSIRMGTGTTLADANKKLNSISIGVDAGASATSSTAIGANAKARADYSVALGDSAVSGDNTVGAANGGGGAIAIGRQSMANNYNAIAIGMSASVSPAAGVTTASDGIAIGSETVVDNYKGIAVGAYSQAKGRQSTVIANNVQGSNYSTASGDRSQVYGAETTVSGNNSVAIGDTNTVASDRTYVMGNNINAPAGTQNSLAFGTRASVGGASSIAMGLDSKTNTDGSIAMGLYSEAGGPITNGKPGINATAIGTEAKALGLSAVAMGYRATVENGHDSIAIGVAAKSTNKKSTAIGTLSEASGEQSTVISNNYDAKGGQSISIASGRRSQIYGAETTVSGEQSVAIGDTNNVASARTYAIGNNINVAAGANDSLAFGTRAHVSGANQVSIGKDAGADAAVPNTSGIVIGESAGRYLEGGTRNTAIGERAGQYVKGSYNIAMGTNAGSRTATDTLVVDDSTSIGHNAKAVTSESIAIGKNAESGKVDKFDGKKATAIGHEAKALGTGNIAMGAYATSENGHDGVAIGTYVKSSNVKAIAIGAYSSASGVQSIAIANNYNSDNSYASNKSTATGVRAIVMGAESHATAERALAIGDKNTVASARTYAIGNNINVAAGADDSLVFGTRAAVGAENTVAIGANANAAQANSVALGAGSATSDVNTGDYTLTTSYTAAGQPVAANGTVSVGSAGKERQIQNVAAGVISATSTDAINGSQLYATNNYMNNFAGDVKTKLGGNAALGNDGHLTMTNIGGTGENTVDDAIKNLKTAIDNKADTTASVTSENQADIKVDKEAPVGNTTNYKLSLGGDAKAKLAKAATALQTVEGDSNITATKDATDPTKVKLALNRDLTADSLTLGDKAGDHAVVNKDGLTIANGPSVKKDGINAGNKKITGVANGNVATGSTDAVNGGQLAEVKSKADSAVQNVVSANPTALTATKAGDTVTLTPNFIAGDLVNPATGAVNTPAAGDAGKLVTAGTVANALANTHFVVDTAKTDGELDAASTHDQKVKAGNKVTLQAGKNLKAKQTNGTDGAQVEFSLKDSISLTQVTAGDSTLNTDGLTIANGPSVTKTGGINAGNKKITGVANGNVAAGSTDAVNGGQLAEVKSKADSAVQNVVSANPTALTATKAGDTVTLTPNFIAGDLVNADGTVNAPAAADEGKLVSAKAVADALKANHFVVDTKANGGKTEAGSEADAKVGSSNKVTFEAGKNLTAKQANTANGGATVKFSLQDDISLNSVTAGTGDSQVVLNDAGVNVGNKNYINKDGLNANGNKVANVKAGDVSATSTDAVNGAQLHNVATSVANVLGGNAAVDGNGNVTSSNIGGTGVNTVDDAIKAVNATAAKHTTVVEGKNVKVTKGKNAAGGDEYTVATKDDLDVTSVTAGNTTVNTNGLTITGGPSVTRGGIDAGDRVISGVKAGDVSANSKEAVNGSQLYATNTKLDGVKAKADTAVQDVKSGDENALTAVKDPNTNIVTVTPKLSGDLVDADGNITAPTTPADKGKLVTAGTVAQALANTHFVVDTKATDGELDSTSQADQKIKAGNKVTLQAGKNLKAKQTNGTDGAQVEFSLKDSISLTQVTAGTGDNQVVLGNDGVQVGGNTYINKDGLNANNKTITNVAPGAVTSTSNDAVNGSQLYNVADNVKDLIGPDAKIDPATGKVTVADPTKGIGETGKGTIGEAIKSVKDKADTAVQDIKSGDEKALSVTKAGNTYTITPNLSGDLVDADGNITAPATDADKGKLVTAGTVAQALANTHFVVDTEKTDGELDNASKHDQKIKAGNKVTLQAGKNLKAKQTNGTNGAQVEFSLKDSISLTQVTAGTGDNQVVLGNDGVQVGGNTYINKDGLNANNKVISNVANGVAPTDAVNKGQLDAVKNVADSAVQSVDVVANENNLVVDNTDPKNPKLRLRKAVDLDSIKLENNVGEKSFLNSAGLTIKDGPAVTRSGINANNTKVTNVTDGDVNGTSKDAVNGSQLYNVASNVKDLIGPDAAIDPATGKVTVADPAQGIAGTGKGTIGEAIKSVKDKADTAVQDIKSGDEKALSVTKAGNTYTITPNLSGDLVDADGNITAPTTAADKGKLVTAGTVAQALANTHFVVDTQAATDGELDTDSKHDQKIKAGNKVTLQAGKNLKAKQTNGTDGAQVEFSLKDSISLTQVTAGEGDNQVVLGNDGVKVGGNTYINNAGLNANGNKITNVADGVDPTDAVNKGQLDAVKTVADSAVKSVDVANGEQNLVVDNSDPKNPKLSLKKDLTVDSVKAGDSTLNTDGLTIAGGPSVKKDGINAGDKTITNVADGVNAKDAVNKGQLDAVDTKVSNVAQNVVNVLGGDAKAEGNGDITMSNIGGTGKNTVHDAIAAVNKSATAAKTKVVNGKNITVDPVVNPDGSTTYTISTAENLDVTSVTAGDSTLNNDGLTITGGPSVKKDGIDAADKKITNVAPGAVTPTSKDAVNGSQLYSVAGNVKDLIGPDVTIDSATGNITVADPAKGIGGTGKGTIGDAIAAVNKSAVAANTKVKAGSNITVNEVIDEKDGSKTYTVSTAKDLNVDSVKAGNTTINNNGIEIVNGPSMTKDGINAAGKAISNVANGNVVKGSKDAVNGGQLHETAQSVADVIGGGATVKDGKVVAGQNGIGNTGQNTVHGAIAAINQNTANNFNQIRGDLRKMDRDLRGGIAGALATAGLPQAFRPGKSMVAAAASTYRGQSGLAIGVSRISDNGKVILKVTGNTNSRGDFGGTIGAGYQW